MLLTVWVVLVLVGSGAAYFAMIRKKAAVFTSLVATGAFVVAGFGAFGLEVPVGVDGGQVVTYTATATPVAILLFVVAMVSVITLLAAATGQLDADMDRPGGRELREELQKQ